MVKSSATRVLGLQDFDFGQVIFFSASVFSSENKDHDISTS